MTTPKVTVLTNERDFAADDVIWRLLDAGVDVSRLNAEGVVEGRQTVALEAVRAGEARGAVWWRQFEIDKRVSTLAEADELLVERAQWRAWVATLRQSAIWVNDLWAARKAENKVEQLGCAALLGGAVPSTIVTNDRDAAAEFATNVGRCVVKTLSAGYFELTDQSFVFTTDLASALSRSSADWAQQPVIVQQRIDRTADVRVVSFGGNHFGAACASTEIDWRLESGQVTWRRWPVPSSLASFCSAYLQKLGLRFAAFDFAIDDHGEAWFLEANQAGEWLFLDRPLELGISAALSEFLADTARSAS